MIKFSKGHYLVLIQAINESLPRAKADKVDISRTIQFVDIPPIYTEDEEIIVDLDEKLFQNLVQILKYHPEEEVGRYYINDLKILFDI